MCNCITEIIQRIKEIDPESTIEETQYYKVGKMIKLERRMCAHYRVRLKNRNHQFTNRKYTNILDFKYCPFCGEKYE